jgi:dipeptidyl aminopeptidase/acylaminoacyl peptidase
MPHGGPESRDVYGFDWLAQFFAAKGYAIIQSNYRGSGGYGDDWAGDGGFKNWRQAVTDISDGVQWLLEEDIVDSSRICAVGWSYGGYAALMSAIEKPELYNCVVSIAGVTDPGTLIADGRRFVSGSKRIREFVGTDDEVIKLGSPLKRSSEIQVPVLLIHGDADMNVTVKHSKKMHKALRKADKDTRLIIYEDAAHGIEPESYRIEMLSEIARFLDSNIAG